VTWNAFAQIHQEASSQAVLEDVALERGLAPATDSRSSANVQKRNRLLTSIAIGSARSAAMFDLAKAGNSLRPGARRVGAVDRLRSWFPYDSIGYS